MFCYICVYIYICHINQCDVKSDEEEHSINLTASRDYPLPKLFQLSVWLLRKSRLLP